MSWRSGRRSVRDARGWCGCTCESLVLAVLGGALALGSRAGGVRVLSTLPRGGAARGLSFHADARMLAFVACVSMVSALLFGLVPAWRASRATSPSCCARAPEGRDPAPRRLGRWLVACQVALSVLLLVAPASSSRRSATSPGSTSGSTPTGCCSSRSNARRRLGPGQVGPLQHRLIDRVSAGPGVRSVTAIRNGVNQSAGTRSRVTLPGRTLGPDDAWNGAEVGPAFFETWPFRCGRTHFSGPTRARPAAGRGDRELGPSLLSWRRSRRRPHRRGLGVRDRRRRRR